MSPNVFLILPKSLMGKINPLLAKSFALTGMRFGIFGVKVLSLLAHPKWLCRLKVLRWVRRGPGSS